MYKRQKVKLELAIAEILAETISKNPSTSFPQKSLSVSHSSKPASKKSVETKSSLPSLDKILQKWLLVWEKAKKKNHSLAFILTHSVPLRKRENKIIIGARFKLHFEKLQDKKMEKILKRLLEKVFKQKVDYSVVEVSTKNKKVYNKNKEKLKELRLAKEKESLKAAKEVFEIET